MRKITYNLSIPATPREFAKTGGGALTQRERRCAK